MSIFYLIGISVALLVFVLPTILILKSKWLLELKIFLISVIVGSAIMFYDFDFFLNVGGPSIPITDELRSMTGVDTLFILPLISALIGLLTVGITKLLKLLNSKNE